MYINLKWDLRTFKLLHTVKDFKESNLAFNFTGSAIYSGKLFYLTYCIIKLCIKINNKLI